MALLVCSIPTPCFANNTTEELYELYELQPQSSCDANVLKTLHDYNTTKKQAIMYSNLLALSANHINEEELLRQVQYYENQLNNSYNRSFDQIIRLEDELLNAKERYNNAVEINKRKLKLVSVNVAPVTYEECQEAKALYQKYTVSQNLGDFKLDNAPLETYKNIQNIDDATIYNVAPDTMVRSIFNGKVTSISENTIVISDADYVSVHYKGINNIAVHVNDNVTQGQPLGLSESKLLVGIDFNGQHRSLAKLLSRSR